MSNSHDTDDTDSNRTLTRRRALAAVASTAGTGLGAVALAGQEASADLTMDSLTVADGRHESADPQVTPVVTVDARLDYTVASATEHSFALELGPTGGALSLGDVVSTETDVTDGTVEETLTAPVTEADGITPSEFEPEPGETATLSIQVGLDASVLDGGQTVVSDSVSDTAEIAVENTSVDTSVSLGGDGAVTFDSDE